MNCSTSGFSFHHLLEFAIMTRKTHLHTYIKVLIFDSKESTGFWSPSVTIQGSMDVQVRMMWKQQRDNWQTSQSGADKPQQLPTPAMAESSAHKERDKEGLSNLQESVISWMWAVRKEYQVWLPHGWLTWVSCTTTILRHKRWNGEKTTQWDTQNWVLRNTSRWRWPNGNQKPVSETKQATVQGRLIGPTWNSRSYRRHLDAAGSGGHEAGQTPHRKPELSMRSTEGLRLPGSDHHHYATS